MLFKWKLWGSLSKLVAKRLYSLSLWLLLCFPLLDLSPLSAVIYMLGRIHGLVPVVFLPRLHLHIKLKLNIPNLLAYTLVVMF